MRPHSLHVFFIAVILSRCNLDNLDSERISFGQGFHELMNFETQTIVRQCVEKLSSISMLFSPR